MHEIFTEWNRFRRPKKVNTQLTRQNEFSFTKIKLVYCLTKKTLKFNSLIPKIFMFPQKETLLFKRDLDLGPQGPKHVIFYDSFFLENCQRGQIPFIPSFRC